MAGLTSYLAERGLIFIDDVYNELSELALTYLKIDERDIMASMVVDIDGKGEKSVNGRPAGNGAEAEARNLDCEDTHDEDHEVQQVGPLKADDENVPSSESAQESPETHNVRRQKEIAEAEEHLLGSVMTAGCDETLKPIDVTEKRLPSTYIRKASNQHVEDEMINDNMPSKTSKTSGITSKDFSDVGLEVQSLFQRPKPAKVQVLIPLAPGSLVEGPPGQGSVPPTLKDDSTDHHLKLESHDAPPSNGSSTFREKFT